MGNINERLKAYHKQAEKWCNTYEMVLAKDVLVMMEELQGDLEDIVERLKKQEVFADKSLKNDGSYFNDVLIGYRTAMNVAIQIVKGGKVMNNKCVLVSDVIKAVDKHTREDGTLDDDISCILEEVESVDAKDTNVPGKWIPVKWHEMTEEEREDGCYSDDITYIFDCKMPDDGDEILVTNGKRTWEDMVGFDDEGYYLESGCDWRDIAAWMPLPEPYREVTDEENPESRR